MIYSGIENMDIKSGDREMPTVMYDFGAKRLKKRLHNGGLFKKTRLYTRISEYTVQLR